MSLPETQCEPLHLLHDVVQPSHQGVECHTLASRCQRHLSTRRMKTSILMSHRSYLSNHHAASWEVPLERSD